MIVTKILDTTDATAYADPVVLSVAKPPMCFFVDVSGTGGSNPNFAGLCGVEPKLDGLSDTNFQHWYYDDTFTAGLAGNTSYLFPIPDNLVFNCLSAFISSNGGGRRIRVWVAYNHI